MSLSKYAPSYPARVICFFSRKPYRIRRTTHRASDGLVHTDHKEVANDVPQVAAFARTLGVDTKTLYNWQKAHPEFATAWREALTLQEEFLVTNALRGLTNHVMTIFYLKNKHGYHDGLPADTVPRIVNVIHAYRPVDSGLGTLRTNGHGDAASAASEPTPDS